MSVERTVTGIRSSFDPDDETINNVTSINTSAVIMDTSCGSCTDTGGAAGATGPKGDTGATGPAGADGTNVLEYAVLNDAAAGTDATKVFNSIVLNEVFDQKVVFANNSVALAGTSGVTIMAPNSLKHVLDNRLKYLGEFTFASLPAASQGDRAICTDIGSVSTFMAVLTVGGGSTVTPVVYNGTNWIAG